MDETTRQILEEIKNKLEACGNTYDVAVKSLDAFLNVEEKPPETPKVTSPPQIQHEYGVETPTAPPVDAKRLDRIWKYLQGFVPADVYGEFNHWAVQTFDYKYYVPGQKYPIDLRTAVCDKLSTFTESQIAELEKILEAKE